MSDRPQGSVRTGTREESTAATPAGAEAAPAPAETRAEPPASSTQSIPTGQNRVVQAGRPASSPVPPPATGERPTAAVTGSSAATSGATAKAATKARTKAPAKAPAGSSAGAPAKPPATDAAGDTAKVAPAKGSATAGRKPVTKGGRGPRRARLQLRHIDTWSAFKISFVLSIALFFIWMVAVGVLYGVLSGLGVFDTLNELFGQLGSASGSDSGGGDVVTPGVVFGGAAVIGAINIVLMTALCTVGTFIYNLCSDLVGGLELTLSERD
jgi:Transmembrane domain of unknown function (DUF3566)